MIKRYKVENTDNTYLRIWQKVIFNKQILEPDFFKDKRITNREDSYRFNVYQYNPNIRIAYINDYLYWVTSDEAIYNYLDTGRPVTIKEHSYYGEDKHDIYYIFNDILITNNIIKSFENYKDKNNLNLKVLTETEFDRFVLVYNEDLEKIKHRLDEIEAEEKLIKQAQQEEKIQDIQEQEKLASLIRQYDKMTLLEDKDTIISGNYFIDKEKGFKVEFEDKVVKIFSKEDLINEYRHLDNNFIKINYHEFLFKLDKVYRLGKYEEPIEEKLKQLNKKWLSFKIYSYNPETKEEKFLKKIKIENLVNKTGKLRYRINNIKMPIQKMSRVIDFIGGSRWSVEENILTERIENLEKYLEKMRLYSGTQLELLQGKTIEINLKNMTIPIHFNLMAEDKDNWEIGIDNLILKRNYKFIKENFRYISGGGLSTISRICDNLQAGEELENILINKVKEYIDKRTKAEERAEGLFKEFLEKNKTRVFAKASGYVVKGKLKNYIVKMKNEEDVGVWTYPANEYICINEKTKAGRYLCKYDKLLQFCMVMLNDGNLREEIHTIR